MRSTLNEGECPEQEEKNEPIEVVLRLPGYHYYFYADLRWICDRLDLSGTEKEVRPKPGRESFGILKCRKTKGGDAT